ncbi:MAG: hypothetical protein IH840_13795 [Candidatus Heimdallarchaeota archaeon]|nr:hypothetical protein [Candidatus Heimdallarchaeota archaeon]
MANFRSQARYGLIVSGVNGITLPLYLWVLNNRYGVQFVGNLSGILSSAYLIIAISQFTFGDSLTKHLAQKQHSQIESDSSLIVSWHHIIMLVFNIFVALLYSVGYLSGLLQLDYIEIYWIIILSFGFATYSLTKSYYYARMKFRTFSLIEASKFIIFIVSLIIIIQTSIEGNLTLLMPFVVSQFLVYIYIIARDREHFLKVPKKRLESHILNFIAWGTVAAIGGTTYYLSVLYLNDVTSEENVGYWFLAISLGQFLRWFSVVISRILFVNASYYYETEKEKLKNLFQDVLQITFLVTFIPYLLLFYFADFWVLQLYGESLEGGIIYFQFALIATLIASISSMFWQLLVATNRQTHAVLTQIFSFIITILIWETVGSQSPLWIPIGLIVGYTIDLVVLSFISRQSLKINISISGVIIFFISLSITLWVVTEIVGENGISQETILAMLIGGLIVSYNKLIKRETRYIISFIRQRLGAVIDETIE